MGPTSFRGFPHRLNTDPTQLDPDWTPHPQTEQASTERHGLGYIPRLPKTLQPNIEASPPTSGPLRPLAKAGKAKGPHVVLKYPALRAGHPPGASAEVGPDMDLPTSVEEAANGPPAAGDDADRAWETVSPKESSASPLGPLSKSTNFIKMHEITVKAWKETISRNISQ